MKRIYVLYVLIMTVACSCSEPERGIPVNDRTAPLQVENIEITSTPGGAVITYQLPANGNILYVMAEYTLGDGVPRNRKSSYFGQTIELDGFPDTTPSEVNIYSVSRGGIKSEPVTRTIVPLTPPYRTARNSLRMEPTFGGTKIFFENESGANLKFVTISTDSTGNFYQVGDPYYTQMKTGVFAVRGFDTLQRVFGVYTLDRWNNRSDTFFTEITPWYEEELDKSRFANAQLPSDTWEYHTNGGSPIEVAWNDVWGIGAVFHTKPNTGMPQWFTIDLKVQARLSRMKFYHIKDATVSTYLRGDPQIFEIYGSNVLIDDWSSDWTLLGRFESIKPSGEASTTAEDVVYACDLGEDFDFTNNDPFRYLRFKTIKTWGNVSYIYIAELTFWGEVVEKY